MLPSQALIILVPMFTDFVCAHSWIEQLSNIASNASYIGEHGYSRGFVDKGTPGFDQNSNLWMIPPLEQQPPFINADNLLCHPSQRSSNQPSNYPRLKATPGSLIAMRYAENGHVTIPGGGRGLLGKPEKGGVVYVFSTTQPNTNEKISDVLQWTVDGSGGDRRGVLLTSQHFDDGRCYQLGNGAALAISRQKQFPNPLRGVPNTEHELLCETNVRLPNDAKVGKMYSVYWIWQWPTAPGKDPNLPNGRDEYYTSCLDVDIIKDAQRAQTVYTLIQQDPMPTAVPTFQSRADARLSV
jgi:hypothetical protein